ncbi:hypothetical protein FSP39_009131 [Pinctada imbricata]|uniref:Uncharacterized protein n=1 Tax=Pinctada imbricata TaxID=66713 RepID=A0AA88YK62_PINIB|nr:hypothetical protein FSP39_009131 [Pinctada imbricata]
MGNRCRLYTIIKLLLAFASFYLRRVPFAGKSNLPWLEYDTQRRIFMDFDDEAILRQNWKSAMNKFWSEEVSTIPINDDSNFPHDEL